MKTAVLVCIVALSGSLDLGGGGGTPPPIPPEGLQCVNGRFDMTGDVTLTGSAVVNLVGTPTARCAVNGNGFRFIAADGTWTGSFTMSYVDVVNIGTPTLNILGGLAPDSWGVIDGAGAIRITNSTFRRSSGFKIYSKGTSTVTFSYNTYDADNLVSVAGTDPFAPAFFVEGGTSTSAKYFQGNRIFKSWVNVTSANWTVGAGRGCLATACNRDGNIFIGKRAGLGVAGMGSYVAYNYSHPNLDVTPTENGLSQVYNIHNIGAGVVAEHNVLHSGHWLANGIDGELRFNVLTELHPHVFVRIGNGGLVHHNVLLTLYPGLDRYSSLSRLPFGDSAFSLDQPGNNVSFFNNTLDARGNAVRSVLWVIPGATVNSYRNNVAYRLSLIASGCPTGSGCSTAIGSSEPEGYVTPPPARALYLDYNNTHFDSKTGRAVVYDIGVAGKTLGSPGWGGHDRGTLNGLGPDPMFRGPLPMGSGLTGFGSSDDSGFPFNDEDILSGAVTVTDMLTYFRWIYGPSAGSPLIGAQDPQDGPGDIGAVQTATLGPTAPAIVTTNKRPMVHPGPSFSIADTATAAKLSGYAADDSLPNGTLTLEWAVVMGPGSVTFAQPNRGITTARFSTVGLYTLRLTARDGALTSSKDVQIGVGVNVPSVGVPLAPANLRIQ